MRRLLIRVVAFLLLGAIVNAAVAWGCALYISLARLSDVQAMVYARGSADDQFGRYFATRRSRSGAMHVTVAAMFAGRRVVNVDADVVDDDVPGFHEVVPQWAMEFLALPEVDGREPEIVDEATTHTAQIDARGWPLLAMWGGVKLPQIRMAIYDKDGWAVPLEKRRYWTIELASQSQPVSYSERQMLPLRPIWPGFAINTVFYAVILWLLFAGPFALRRWRRIRRGLCPKCAYDLRGSTSKACPECGTRLCATDTP